MGVYQGQLLLAPVLLVFIFSGVAEGFKMFQDRVPNGEGVPHPCFPNYLWYGVGHKNREGGGATNLFGLDFMLNGYKWDECLCRQDSDGDGMTNGEELGDPNCVWEEDKIPTRKSSSHPGICEPIDDPKCVEKNGWDLCTAVQFECEHMNKTKDVRILDVRFPSDSRVPPKETTYSCQVFAMPDDDEFHMIATEPLVDNEYVAHHMLLYGCTDPELEVGTKAEECGMAEENCRQIIGMWTVGALGECFDTAYGFRIGQKGFKRVMLQVHWNNPELKTDYTDGSGLRLYYTTDIRDNDAGVLIFGQTLLAIPPAEKRVVAEGVCDERCTDGLDKPINFVAGAFHMHYLGRSGYVSHSRNGTDLGMLISDDVFHYDNPILHVYDNPIEFLPGDTLTIECVFSSKSKGSVTTYGDGTSDEMCFGLLTYYPYSDTFEACTAHGTGLYCPTYAPDDFNESIGDCVIEDLWTTGMGEASKLLSPVCDKNTCREACKEVIVSIREWSCLQPWTAQLTEPVLSEYGTDFHRSVLQLLHSCDRELYYRNDTNETPKGNKWEEEDKEVCPFAVGKGAMTSGNFWSLGATVTLLLMYLSWL